jgi:hypothetical protein
MSEIKKITKYSLYAYAAGGLFFAFLYLVLTDIYMITISDWPYNDPYYPRAFGLTLLVLAIAALLGSFKKEWEELKLTYELSQMWILVTLILNIAELAFLTPVLSVTAVTNTIVNTIILIVFLVMGVYCYLQQRD